jgi:hypothetical protein
MQLAKPQREHPDHADLDNVLVLSAFDCWPRRLNPRTARSAEAFLFLLRAHPNIRFLRIDLTLKLCHPVEEGGSCRPSGGNRCREEQRSACLRAQCWCLVLADKMRGDYASNIIVENRVSVGGQLAVAAAKVGFADGSVMVLAPMSNFSVHPHIYSKIGCDPIKDVTPVFGFGDST